MDDNYEFLFVCLVMIKMSFKTALSCCMIIDRKDHVQYLQFQRAIPDNCKCSLT